MVRREFEKWGRWALLGGVLGLTACASVTHGELQRIRVQAACGDRVVPAQCVLSNDRGQWQLRAPSDLVLTRDASVLQVTCHSPFFGAQTVQVPPAVSVAMVGNWLAGGFLGAGVDVVTGAGLAYPHQVLVHYPACR